MSANDKLTILWTTDNKDTVFNMLAMYALNSKNRGWWKHINIILWGASVKLVANDTQVQRCYNQELRLRHAKIAVRISG